MEFHFYMTGPSKTLDTKAVSFTGWQYSIHYHIGFGRIKCCPHDYTGRRQLEACTWSFLAFMLNAFALLIRICVFLLSSALTRITALSVVGPSSKLLNVRVFLGHSAIFCRVWWWLGLTCGHLCSLHATPVNNCVLPTCRLRLFCSTSKSILMLVLGKWRTGG